MKLRRRHRELSMLTISALDLFASALGVFILMTFLLYPYYQRLPALIATATEKKAELSARDAAFKQVLQSQMDTNKRYQEVKTSLSRLYEQKRSVYNELAAAQAANISAKEALDRVKEKAAKANSSLPPQPVSDLIQEDRPFGDLDIDHLDLVFVIDTTSSMKPIIDGLRADLAGIITVLHRLAPSLRLGIVAYKDSDSDSRYLTRVFPLRLMTNMNVSIAETFVADLKAAGGGDIPERVDAGLERAFAMRWRDDADSWIVVIGDARVHAQRRLSLLSAVDRFRKGGDRRKISAIFVHRLQNQLNNLTQGSRESIMKSQKFFNDLAQVGGGSFVAHQQGVMESVLLSILD